MSDLFWPELLTPGATTIDVIDSVARFPSSLNGVTTTASRPGSRLRMSMTLPLLVGRERALLRSLISATRGGTIPIRIADHSYVKEGSVSASEHSPNPTFASGTTGLTAGSAFSISVADRRIRALRSRNTTGTDGIVRLTNAAAVTPYRPYVGRAIVIPGRGPANGLGIRFGSTAFGAEYSSLLGLEDGCITHAFVPYDSTTHFGISQGAVNGLAGDYMHIALMSLAPCALVDNGPNYLAQSANLSHATWTKSNLTVSATSATLPDGSSGTVNTLAEDGAASSSHFIVDGVTVSSAVQDVCAAGAFKAANRSWIRLSLRETTGSGVVEQYLNLSNGALGTASTGTNWANARAFVVDLGNGWYYLCLIARKTNDATGVDLRIHIAEADNDASFSGLSQDSIYVWNPALAISGVPVRLTGTSAAAETGAVQNLGGGIHTKGWPASTSGLLLEGDQIEINGQPVILSGSVNSDAAGRAFLPLPMLRKAPADNDPIIINRPMGRWIPESPENRWSNMPGLLVNSELTLIETA